MPFDCRVDRRSLGDELDLPALTWDRLDWTAPTDGRPSALELVRSLTKGQWAMLVLEVAQGQVDNGGFMQFFDNKGEYLSDVVDAARLVSADTYVPLLERAMRVWPEGLPWDLEERRAYLDRHMADEARSERLAERLAALDDDFYAVGGLDLVGHALRHADQHPDDFFLSPEAARQDVDDFIARLRSRIGPLPVASSDAIARVEAEVGQELPELVRRLYLEVGDGGWGPDRGVLTLCPRGEGDLLDHLAQVRDRRGPAGQRWPEATIPFCIGRSGIVCIDLDDPTLEPCLLPSEGETPWSSFDHRPLLRYVAASLRGWLEHWLREPDAGHAVASGGP